MDLHRLNHLVCLAETGNFTRAALRCHISQSALSRSIQAAENECGMQLFNRKGLAVTCTDAGAFVVERARKILFESRSLQRDVDMYRERLLGDLTLGVGPYPAAVLLPPLLNELRTRHQGVTVRVEINNAEHLAAHLKAEELDFYLADLRNVQADADLSIVKIGHLEAGFYVRPGHGLLADPQVTPAKMLPYGIASVRAPREVLRGLGQMMGLPPGEAMPLAVECDDLQLLMQMAMTTDTVVACAVAVAQPEVERQRLVRLVFTGMPTVYADMAIVSLKGRSFSPMAQFACDFIAAQAQRLA